MSTTQRDYYEVLGVSRDGERAGDQEGLPQAGARAASGRLGAPRRRGALPRGDRGLRGALEPRDAPALRPLRPRRAALGRLPADATSTSTRFGDLFSAFFGEDLFGGRRRGGAARGADVIAEVEITLVEAAQGQEGRRSRSRPPSPAATCSGNGAAPGIDAGRLRHAATASAYMQQVSRGILGEFIRNSACPDCNGAGRRIEQACDDLRRRGAHARGAQARGRDPRGHPRRPAHPASPAKATPAGSARAGRRLHPGAGRRRPRFVREGNDIFSQVNLTIVEAALGATVQVETLEGPGARVRPGHPAGRDPRAARQGDAGAAGLRPRRPARPRQRHRAPQAHARAAAAARGVRGALRRRDLPPSLRLLREAAGTSSTDPRRRDPRRGRARPRSFAPGSSSSRPRGSRSSRPTGGVELAAYGAGRRARARRLPRRGRHRGGRRLGGPLARVPPRRSGSDRSGSARPGRSRRPERLAVVIDPGRAFGTGAHASTRLALELLLEPSPAALLDVGCGSGVLSIAAARLGFAPVIAVDVDEVAVEVTRENAAANGVEIDAQVGRRSRPAACPRPSSPSRTSRSSSSGPSAREARRGAADHRRLSRRRPPGAPRLHARRARASATAGPPISSAEPADRARAPPVRPAYSSSSSEKTTSSRRGPPGRIGGRRWRSVASRT